MTSFFFQKVVAEVDENQFAQTCVFQMDWLIKKEKNFK